MCTNNAYVPEHIVHGLLQEPQGNSGAELGAHVAGTHTLQAYHSCRPQGGCQICPPGSLCGSCCCHPEERAPALGMQEGETAAVGMQAFHCILCDPDMGQKW